MLPFALEIFIEMLPRKHPWWSHLSMRWLFRRASLKDSITDLLYLTKLFKKDDLWHLLLNSLREFLLTYLNFSLCKFLSAVIFYNVTPNVNKNLLQIALLKHTPYRISMPLSFLEDLTQIIFRIKSSRIDNWFLQLITC